MTKNILASSLLDWTRNSETTFITAEMNAELVAKAEKLGIVLPSSDLAIFKTIYAEIDKVNRNGVVLPRKAVEVGLPTLRGKQINWEHFGAGRICGYILDAEIVDDKIVVYGTLFKSLFVKEFNKVEKLFTKKKLFVSFEIWNRDEKGDSVLHILSNGDRAIDPIIFHGCGLLLENPPACPNARVLQLIASQKVVDEAELIVKEIMEKDENLVYAEIAIEERACKGCNPCTCNKNEGGETTKMAEKIKVEEVNTAIDAVPAKVEDIIPTEQTPTEIENKEEEKKEEAVVIPEIKPEEAAKIETTPEEVTTPVETTPKEEEVAAIATPENKEDAGVVTQTQEIVKTDEITPTEEVCTTEVKTETVTTNDEGAVIMKIEEQTVRIETYTREQVDMEVKAAVEEKDKEIAKLKEELASKPEIKIETAETTEKVELEVGTVEPKKENRYKAIRSEIDKRAFNSTK
jgi:hypothetical protein